MPLRHERMAESAFAYYRGTPAVMAFDLASTPRSDILVQASGDAHLSNFGLFASPERTLVFDANDFDETLPGPWEWDVKRLAASVVIAGRRQRLQRRPDPRGGDGDRPWLPPVDGPVRRHAPDRRLVRLRSPTPTSARLAKRPGCSGVAIGAARRARLEAIFTKARRRDGMRAFESLTGGRRRAPGDPRGSARRHARRRRRWSGALEKVFTDYRATMPENRRDFLERYRFVDFALKVVGVGSVGTRCFVIVLQGRDENDPLILQAKEATASVMEPYLEPSAHDSHAQRVVVGQQLMQATSDIFLGWTRGPGGRDFYLRQLWDMKGSVDTTILQPPGMGFYGGLCGWSLARAHARTGDAAAIAAYLGTPTRSTGRSPTSPRRTRTSTRATTRHTWPRSRPGQCRCRPPSEPGPRPTRG